jgi:uncharacterized protein YggU (UPF0235/DUF167 family)
VVLRVRLTPRAAKDAVEGLEETADGVAIKARVRALPENGAANAALERLIADWLSVPKSLVTVSAGTKSRVKTVSVSGDATDLGRSIESKLAERLNMRGATEG